MHVFEGSESGRELTTTNRLTACVDKEGYLANILCMDGPTADYAMSIANHPRGKGVGGGSTGGGAGWTVAVDRKASVLLPGVYC